MANIHQSLLESVKAEDLIYFVEDDYLHSKDCLEEMIFAYERISTQLGNELFLCPADYPYLYSKFENTNIILEINIIGEKLRRPCVHSYQVKK